MKKMFYPVLYMQPGSPPVVLNEEVYIWDFTSQQHVRPQTYKQARSLSRYQNARFNRIFGFGDGGSSYRSANGTD